VRAMVSLVALSSMLLSGCVLQGVPDGLDADQAKTIETGTLDQDLTVARQMRAHWAECRNTAQKYGFWSNASLIPLAAGGAAAAIYKGSKDLITGIGLAAGTVIGTNSFIGASSIANGYQSGMNGMVCVSEDLGAYGAAGSKQSDAVTLDHNTTTLETQIVQASAVLAASTGLDMSSAAATAERVANPSVVTALATNEKALTQAISDAQTATVSARTELHLLSTVASFARDRIIDVDNIVAGKIKPGTVNYSALSGSILSTASGGNQPKAAASTGTVNAPAPPAHAAHAVGAAAAAAAVPTTPIADAANNSKQAADNLVSTTKNLQSETSDFDLSTQEANVTTCLKNL
jgi:hypothetical protein